LVALASILLVALTPSLTWGDGGDDIALSSLCEVALDGEAWAESVAAAFERILTTLSQQSYPLEKLKAWKESTDLFALPVWEKEPSSLSTIRRGLAKLGAHLKERLESSKPGEYSMLLESLRGQLSQTITLKEGEAAPRRGAHQSTRASGSLDLAVLLPRFQGSAWKQSTRMNERGKADSSAQISLDGRWIVGFPADEVNLRVFDLSGRTAPRTLLPVSPQAKGFSAFLISADSKYVIASELGSSLVSVHAIDTGQVRSSFSLNQGILENWIILPGGELILSVHDSAERSYFAVRPGDPRPQLEKLPIPDTGDSYLYGFVKKHGLLLFWSENQCLAIHVSALRAPQVSKVFESNHVYLQSTPGNLAFHDTGLLWTFDSAQSVFLERERYVPRPISISPEGHWLIVPVLNQRKYLLIDLVRGGQRTEFEFHPTDWPSNSLAQSLSSVALSPGGKHLAIAHTSRLLSVWDVRTGRRVGSAHLSTEADYMEWLPDGKRLYIQQPEKSGIWTLNSEFIQ
jgi:hypothetical protein